VPSWLLAYLTFTALLVVTPGSTTAVVVRNTLTGGRSAGLAAALGAAIGNTSHATAAGLGLAVVFMRWPLALTVLRVAGATFLAWLGLVSVYRAVRHSDGGLTVLDASASDAASLQRGSLRQGLTVNLLSPAIATFYLAVVPSFLDAGAPRWYFAALAAAHIVMALACHGAWVIGLHTLRRLFSPPLTRRLLGGATGLALLWLAARLSRPG
jgi:threonine/homoserine/homoserine lactone efflux protein